MIDSPRAYSILMLKRLVISVLIGLSAAVIPLWFEYHSGLFMSTNSSGVPSVVVYMLTALWTMVGLFFTMTAQIWLKPLSHIREPYSAFATLTLCCALAALITTFSSGIFPWDIPWAYRQHLLLGQPISSPPFQIIDFGFLLSLSALLWMALTSQHRSWKGKISIQHYESLQKGEEKNLIQEGLSELKRIISRTPPLPLHRERDSKEFISKLEVHQEMVAWADRARELIRLSSSVYDFSAGTWHKPGVWIGLNVLSNATVYLCPIHQESTDQDIANLRRFINKLSGKSKSKTAETILVTEGSILPTVSSHAIQGVTIRTEEDLLDSLIDFREYENDVRRRVLTHHLPDSTTPISNAYVSPRFFLEGVRAEDQDLEAYLTDWLTEPGRRQIALLGEYGQGKSTAALMLTYKLLQSRHRRIPLLIELRGSSPRNLQPLELLGAWAAKYRVDPQAVMQLIRSGRILLIFEGFDEMALIGDADMRLQHFKTLWQFCYPETKMIVTGRPNFFLDEEEMKAALGITRPRQNQPYCQALRLAPFSISQIRESLRSQKNSVREQISHLAMKNPRFQELVSRPSLLHIVSVLWERDRLSEKIDQLNSAYIMELFVHHSYRRQGRKERDSPDFMALNSFEREYFMTGIAAYMAAQHLPNQISGVQLNYAIGSLLQSIPDKVSTQVSAASGEDRQPLRARFRENEHSFESIMTDVRACGILVDDPASPGSFRFGHKSFMEYLTASVVADLLVRDDPSSARVIMVATHLKLEDLFPLTVAIDFLAEMIDPMYIQNISSVRGPTAEHVRPQDFGLRIFKLIFGGNPIYRLTLFSHAYDASIKKMRWPVNMLTTLFQPSLLIFVALMVLSVMLAFLYKALFPGSITLPAVDTANDLLRDSFFKVLAVVLRLPLPLLLLLITMVIFAMSAFALIRSPVSYYRLRLWNLLCSKVGIPSSTLHRIAWTYLLPWANQQEFRYFLPDEQDTSAVLEKFADEGQQPNLGIHP